MIPLEPIAGLVGIALGAITKIWQMKQENMKIAIIGRDMWLKDVAAARRHSSKNKELQWTKRTIALILTITYCLLHLGVSIPELLGLSSHVLVGYTEVVPKFLFFGEKEAVKWVSVEGAAITPALSNAVWMMMGYYFGSGGTRK